MSIRIGTSAILKLNDEKKKKKRTELQRREIGRNREWEGKSIATTSSNSHSTQQLEERIIELKDRGEFEIEREEPYCWPAPASKKICAICQMRSRDQTIHLENGGLNRERERERYMVCPKTIRPLHVTLSLSIQL